MKSYHKKADKRSIAKSILVKQTKNLCDGVQLSFGENGFEKSSRKFFLNSTKVQQKCNFS